MADPEQKVWTKQELESLAIADYVLEKLTDEYADYPLGTVIMGLLQVVNLLRKKSEEFDYAKNN